jgi:hypothetical protein
VNTDSAGRFAGATGGEDQPVTGPGSVERYPFCFDDPPLAKLSRAFGVHPGRAWVSLDDETFTAVFGPWRVRTPTRNIVFAEISGPYAAWKVVGPARLSAADRGLTFATTRYRGVCILFADPVAGIEPLGLLRHPNLTVTVERPEDLVARVQRTIASR